MRPDISSEEVKIYFDELEEQIQFFESNLLKLETEPDNLELISEIFRSAHTLKGSAFMVGHEPIGKLTHGIENLLDGLRKKEIKLNSNITNILLRGLDLLKVLKSNTKNEDEVDINPVLETINNLIADEKNNFSLSAEEIENILSNSKNVFIYKISIKLSSQLTEVPMRVAQVFSYLFDFGEIYKSNPTLTEVEDEQIGDEINIIFISRKDKKELKDILNIISGTKAIEVLNALPAKPAEVTTEANNISVPKKVIEVKKEETNKQPLEEKENIVNEKSSLPVVPLTSGKSIRMDVEKLDIFIDLLGELVIDRTRLIQLGIDLENKFEDDFTVTSLNLTFNHLDKITTDLHQQIIKTRLLPLEIIFNKFPRMIRDISLKSAKEINFLVYGKETELDRQIIDQIVDPLIHLLRNAVDHGIEKSEERKNKGKVEKGTIILSAKHYEDKILITLEDDGKGIDISLIKEKAVSLGLISKNAVEKLTEKKILDFIFMSGFSTKEIAGEVSGRGIGMDIVKTNIEKLNGSIALETKKDVGTKIYILLPLTLAIIKSLLVKVNENVFAFPLSSVVETLFIIKDEIKTVGGEKTICSRGEILPILSLRKIFQFKDINDNNQNYFWVAIINWGDKKAGFIVDSLIGDQDIVVKQLSPLLGKVDVISGTAILGSGEIALIVDIAGIIKLVTNENELEI